MAQDMTSSVFSIAYFPPVSYLKECLKGEEIIIESKEHFIKQTYRNRCHIYGANGILTLIIPVLHKNIYRTPIEEVSCSMEENWKRIHWRSISSAYRKSPYFEYYEEELKIIFQEDESNLFSFSMKCFRTLLNLIKIDMPVHFTGVFEKNISHKTDLRDAFHPKKPKQTARYHQVFEERHGFIHDLSGLDLICNLGPRAKEFLLQE